MELAKKFAPKSRTRSMSGLITLDMTVNQNTQIIDIDFDYDESKNQRNEHRIGLGEIPSEHDLGMSRFFNS